MEQSCSIGVPFRCVVTLDCYARFYILCFVCVYDIVKFKDMSFTLASKGLKVDFTVELHAAVVQQVENLEDTIEKCGKINCEVCTKI